MFLPDSEKLLKEALTNLSRELGPSWCRSDCRDYFINTLFLQNWGFYNVIFVRTDRISLRAMPLKPLEWSFKLQTWAFGAFTTLELKVLGPVRFEA